MRTVHLSRCGLVILLFLAIWNVGQAQDSLGMSRVSTLDYWDWLNGIQMVGDLVYTVCGNTLHITNLADPAHPIEIGQASWSDSWSGNSVYVIGNLAYVNPGYGVIVYDVSDPTLPVTLVDWHSGGQVRDFMPLGDIAIMKILDGGLCIVDISDLGNIHIIGGNFPPEPSCPVLPVGMVGEYLCLRGVGLSMWDISDPTLPVQVAVVDTQFWFWGDATISGNYVYAGTYADGLRIIDISNPLQPFEVGACDSGVCAAVTVTGNHAVLGKGYTLNIWNITDPVHPVFEGSLIRQPGQPEFTGLASLGNIVCVGNGFYGGRFASDSAVTVVDISNPAIPAEVVSFGQIGYLRRIAVNGTLGCLTDGLVGFHIIDLTSLPQANELSHLRGIFLEDAVIHGHFLYGVERYTGLLTYDITDPAEPESLNCWESVGMRWRPGIITTAGEYAYAVSVEASPFTYCMYIFSLADPANPVLVDSMQLSGAIMTASNGYIYVCSSSNFEIYSLANPTSPQLVGSCAVSGLSSLNIAIGGDYAYVTTRENGVKIIRIADPVNPGVFGSVGANYVTAVAANENTLIFSQYPPFSTEGVIYAMDLADPVHPVEVGHYNIDEEILDMEIFESYLLTISTHKFTVYQVDALSTVQTPQETPHEFALYPCYPNPFNASAVLKYSLPVAGQIRLTIHNLLGQRVVTLYEGMQLAGTYTATWDASQIGSGLYFAQLQSDNNIKTIKMVLLK